MDKEDEKQLIVTSKEYYSKKQFNNELKARPNREPSFGDPLKEELDTLLFNPEYLKELEEKISITKQEIAAYYRYMIAGDIILTAGLVVFLYTYKERSQLPL